MGKWAERIYKGSDGLYPPYANGAGGYVISKDIARYVTENSKKLYSYSNEDAALGIWLSRAPFERNEFNAENIQMISLGVDNCHNKTHLVIGHHIRPELIEWCYTIQHGYGNL